MVVAGQTAVGTGQAQPCKAGQGFIRRRHIFIADVGHTCCGGKCFPIHTLNRRDLCSADSAQAIISFAGDDFAQRCLEDGAVAVACPGQVVIAAIVAIRQRNAVKRDGLCAAGCVLIGIADAGGCDDVTTQKLIAQVVQIGLLGDVGRASIVSFADTGGTEREHLAVNGGRGAEAARGGQVVIRPIPGAVGLGEQGDISHRDRLAHACILVVEHTRARHTQRLGADTRGDGTRGDAGGVVAIVDLVGCGDAAERHIFLAHCQGPRGVSQGIAQPTERRTTDHVTARIDRVLRCTAVTDAAQLGVAVTVDPARDHRQSVATREGLAVIGFAGIVEAHRQARSFAVNGVRARAQGRGESAVLFVAVVAVEARVHAQPRAARHRAGVERGAATRADAYTAAARERDVAASGGAGRGGCTRIEHQGGGAVVVGADALCDR